MIKNDVQKKMRLLARQIRRSSNTTTLLLVGLVSYTIYQWHSLMGIDKVIHALIIFLVMAVNIRFYLLHANLSSEEADVIELHMEKRYKEKKGEYEQFQRLSLWMAAALVLIKLLSL